MPPSGVRHFSRYLHRLFDHGPRDQEPRVVRGPQRLHLGDRHRAFVAGAGDVGPAALPHSGPGWSASPPCGSPTCTCWRSDSLVIMP